MQPQRFSKPSLLLSQDFKRPVIRTFSLQLIVEFPSLLLFGIKDAPAIRMVTLTNFSLQLIIETPSLLLLHNFECPAITAVTNVNFLSKFIVESISGGSQFAPNFNRPIDLDTLKLNVVVYAKISLHVGKDCGIFCEGE